MGANKRNGLIKHFKKCCVYCELDISKTEGIHGTRDHWVPKRKGGTNGPHNYVLACSECNKDKGSTSGYTFILGTYLEKEKGLFGMVRAIILTNRKVRAIEGQLKERLNLLAESNHAYQREMARNAHQNRLPPNLKPQA